MKLDIKLEMGRRGEKVGGQKKVEEAAPVGVSGRAVAGQAGSPAELLAL